MAMSNKNDDTVVLTPSARLGALRNVGGCDLRKQEDLLVAYLRLSGTRRPHVFISSSASEFAPLAKSVHESRGDLRLLLLDEKVRPQQRELLSTLFRYVLTPEVVKFSPLDELIPILDSPQRKDLFVGGVVDSIDRVLILYRGDLDRVVVPFNWFTEMPATVEPAFDALEIIDYGQTVRLGSYEAATDAILYEFDSDFRRRAKQRELRRDESFGASLRRLRLLKGLSRDDFPGISAKTIARIERGEVEKPREGTLESIAACLDVRPEDMSSY
jgi:DNA-binding Xre family transcriptional regulator